MSSHLRTFLLGTTQIDQSRILLAGAIRTTVLLGISVSVAIYAGNPEAGIPLTIGILLVALAEAGEEVGRRWRTMLWTNLWLMVATLAAGLVADIAVAVVIGSILVAFAGGLVGAAGPRAAVGGVLALVVFIVFASAPELPAVALDNALLMGLGGLLITAATVLPRIIRDPGITRVALSPVPPMWPRIREHLKARDVFLRHAVRLSVAIGVATIISETTTYPHDYWLPMTVAWVTKPDVNGTVTRVATRIVGTVIGLGLSAILLLYFGVSGYAAAAVVAIAGGIAVALIWANYAIGVSSITVLVVVMFSFDGDPLTEDLILRLVATLLAGVIAIAASYVWRADVPPKSPG